MRQFSPDEFGSEPSDSDMILAEVVALIGRDNYLAFEMFYKYYKESIIRYFVAKWRYDKEHAADRCQDTFTRVWKCFERQDKTLSQIETVNHLRNRIYKIADHVAIDDLRKKKIDFYPLPDSDAYIQYAELTVEGHENRICDGLWFQEKIAQVPLKYREPLLLKYEHGFSQKDIAAQLGISEAAVSMHVSSGKTILRRQYFPVPIDLRKAEALKRILKRARDPNMLRDVIAIFDRRFLELQYTGCRHYTEEQLRVMGFSQLDKIVAECNGHLLNARRIKWGDEPLPFIFPLTARE